jgi:hypothetical protein
MRLKRLLGALALCSTSAFAAGQYDGIYHLGGAQWFSVHQNGGQLIVGSFWQVPVLSDRPIDFFLGDGQIMHNVPRLDSWDLHGGPISGNTATVAGENNFGACNAAYHIVFDGTGGNVTRQGMSQTALGNSRGIDCGIYYQRLVNAFGTTFRITRIF